MSNNNDIDINSVVAAHKTKLDDTLTRSEIMCIIKLMDMELEQVSVMVDAEINKDVENNEDKIAVEFSDIIAKVSKLFAKYLQENNLVYGSEQRQREDGKYELVVITSKIVREASVDIETTFNIDTSGEVVVKNID